ncbi:MAG TPA: c-type cytochrome [Planctomycetota bacterium]|nr:c-type cytochrome [Planctomycetota bacterium]
MRLSINGQEVAVSNVWERPVRLNVSEYLHPGASNELSVLANNQGGPAGLVVELVLMDESGSTSAIRTGDDHWQVRAKGATQWTQPKNLGPLGVAPWGQPEEHADPSQFASPPPPGGAELQTLPGFRVQRIYTVPKETMGSWVSLAQDDLGRLCVSDQADMGLFRITLTEGGTGKPDVDPIPVPLSGAQGLAWVGGALYVHKSGDGLFRVTDSDGDDQLDLVERLPGASGGGEHGNHGIIPGPNGTLLLTAGNHTELPHELWQGRAASRWQEDLLLPRLWDANGHARGILAPGGWIAEVSPSSGEYRVITTGFRNTYDLAQNRFGDLFVFDSDMEWDMGMPWYRPTRICLAQSGADFGWRSGSGKWPDYYEDSLPALVDIGPGSPTGVVFGTGSKFPPRYQDALFALDWTFGTIYAIHITPEGAGYVATPEEFVSGAPLPLTDAIVGLDGALYFTTGGRGTQSGLYRVTYEGEESTGPANPASHPEANQARELRHRLETYHGRIDPQALDLAWPYLGSPDRVLRFAARLAIEAQPVSTWAGRAIAERDPQARITAAVALARSGTEDWRGPLLEDLLGLPLEELTEGQFLGAMRAYGLVFLRMGAPGAALRERIEARLLPLLPASSAHRNTELIRLLVYLESPGIVPKTLALIAATPDPEPTMGSPLIRRNEGYGGSIARMLATPPPTQALGYAFLLRNVHVGWSLAERRAYLDFLQHAATFPGGNSYTGFLEAIRADFLANASEEERAALAGAASQPLASVEDLVVKPPQGPGRAWTVAGALTSLKAPDALRNRDFEAGRNLFHAAACVACHRYDGQGGSIGPDLTTVRNKFQLTDLMESIVEPSKIISDQYGSALVTLRDGSTAVGRVIERDGKLEIYGTNPTADPIRVERSKVLSMVPSPTSQMPPGLLNALSEDEMRDLVAFLLSRGNPADPMFAR